MARKKKKKQPTNKELLKEINAENEKEFLRELKKKNTGFLVDLSILERERVAQYICDRFQDAAGAHKDLTDKITEYDEVYRMTRKEVLGSDGNMPNYRSPLSSVTLEVVHANIMNVFFTPADPIRVLPTEENDVSKVKKLDVFSNWSAKNELNLFENFDRLNHSSSKVGECPYMVHWVKEYGTEIKREFVMNPANEEEPLYDPDTKKPIFQEREVQKLLYNGPKLEIFSRKDYFQPEHAVMDKVPEWEGLRIRMTYDDYLRDMYKGDMYPKSIEDIKDWSTGTKDTDFVDFEGMSIPTGKWEKEFRLWFGTLRVNAIKSRDGESAVEETYELEDEFIAIVNIEDGVLCSLRQNKFPMKQRPVDVDYFYPDDEGRKKGIGIMEFMEGPQKAYDALYNQFMFSTVQSNNPVIFFTPTGNMRNEPIKIQNGFMYPTADPNSLKVVQFPAPNSAIQDMLEIVSHWAQLLFGISEYSAGLESRVDPSAPAKKAEIVVAQGSVRLNMIIKRKNKTLQKIMERWFLLYKDNMPKHKFMRIAGEGDNPWKFKPVTLQDFALESPPDFELVGNILNVNKQMEANKAIAIYQLLRTDPFFAPQTQPGLKAHSALTKWLIDKLDEGGLSRFLPDITGIEVRTPEEENARFLQGDSGDPTQGEDHVNHLKIHARLIMDPTLPQELKEKLIIPHINKTVEMLQQQVTQQMVMASMGQDPSQQPQQGGPLDAIGQGNPAQTPPQGMAGQQAPRVGTAPAGVPNVPRVG